MHRFYAQVTLAAIRGDYGLMRHRCLVGGLISNFLDRGHIHGIVSIQRCDSRTGACTHVLKAILEAGVVVVHLKF